MDGLQLYILGPLYISGMSEYWKIGPNEYLNICSNEYSNIPWILFQILEYLVLASAQAQAQPELSTVELWLVLFSLQYIIIYNIIVLFQVTFPAFLYFKFRLKLALKLGFKLYVKQVGTQVGTQAGTKTET